MKKNPDNLRIKAHAGFSLVDVMVGMIIALLGVIIMFQVFSVSEDVKRTTTSGGDALQNGASALFVIDRSLKQAGYGIFASTNLAPYPADPTTILPVLITPGTATTSDTIVITSRQGWNFGPFPPDPAAYVSAVPPALTMETLFVDPSGQLISRTAYDNPVYNATIPAAVPDVVISDGIALMKAEYGIDTNGDGVADSWNQTAMNPTNVKAVRLVVVTRSVQPEKPVGGVCNTTTPLTAPTWSGGVALDLSAGLGLVADDWKCYRYKTFENTVPLRNQ
jgi:Tfp pilus assembly protein PilW